MPPAILTDEERKHLGSYYSPENVASAMVRWVVRKPTDRLLDPSCGDGRFISQHRNSVGVDCDVNAVVSVATTVPHATVHAADFFAWADNTTARFECVAGNPPFIRYQRFTGESRDTALRLCQRLGVPITGLASSWASFIVVAASLLKPKGRMAFLVPAEFGHAPYARPLVEYLSQNFSRVHVTVPKARLFPQLSEDVWVLFADGYGGETNQVELCVVSEFDSKSDEPERGQAVSLEELSKFQDRLRIFLLPQAVRDIYRRIAKHKQSLRLGDCAKVGIGYVTGANDFFHLRPSQARSLKIPQQFLIPTVRKASFLKSAVIDQRVVDEWIEGDEPVLLLNIPPRAKLPASLSAYLDSPEAKIAKTAFKCRVRTPWYTVPDVRVPDAFLTYMSGTSPSLVANEARCVCSNSLHAVFANGKLSIQEMFERWRHPFTALSCEIEGHPLGGGMLKIEPREAARVILSPNNVIEPKELRIVEEGLKTLREWRLHV